MRQLLRRLRESARREAGGQGSDGELLEAFRRRGDRDALAALVDRHAAMVLGVCRRSLANPHDADDAFQATFLVLLRNAAAIRPASRVGAWIFGVARRTSAAARVGAARRQRLTQTSVGRLDARVDSPSAVTETAEIRDIVDREVERLPEAFRAAVVQCELL